MCSTPDYWSKNIHLGFEFHGARVSASRALAHSTDAFDFTTLNVILFPDASFCCWENKGFGPRRHPKVCLWNTLTCNKACKYVITADDPLTRPLFDTC